MRPYSRIVQIVSRGEHKQLVALCEDGSVWWLDDDGRFEMITEMEDGRYLVPVFSNEGADDNE
jgi:hypothetical protein